MPSWISRDYACPTCGVSEPEVVDKAAEPDSMACKTPDCDGTRIKTFGFPQQKRMTYMRSQKDHDDLRRQVEQRKQKRAEAREAVKKANAYNRGEKP